MKSFEGKDDPIEFFATRCVRILHKHNMGCCMAAMAWIQRAGKARRYRVSVVVD
jgi:hypothetical protein